MYCTNCGNEIQKGQMFCPHCGTPASLIARAKEGDQQALTQIYESTYNQVYFTIKAMIKDDDAVFDILQDTYMKAFAALDRFEGEDKFTAWLKQIAANTARDWLRKKRPLLFSELSTGEDSDLPAEELFEEDRPDYMPEQVLDQNETKRLIREMIQDLPEDQRAAIGMYYYEEMSVREIAAAMNATENAVKSRLLYARRKLEKKVRELEKQGTKLYGLAPIPFLLWLLRSQEMLGTEVPNAAVLQSVMAGTTGSVAAGATAGAGSAAAVAGTATATAGIGMVKIAIIGFTALAVIGGSIFGGIKISEHEREKKKMETASSVVIESPESQEESQEISQNESPVFTDSEVIVEGSEPTETEAPEVSEPEASEEEPEEKNPMEEALEQYRTIIEQADSYDFGDEAFPNGTYEYALEYMHTGDPVPTLLLCQMGIDYIDHVRVFYYDSEAGAILAPEEILMMSVGQTGGYRSGLDMMGDGNGIDMTTVAGMGREISVYRVVRSGAKLTITQEWTGTIDDSNPYAGRREITWCPVSDMSNFERYR